MATDVAHIDPIQLRLSGRRGRQRLQFDQEWLADAMPSTRLIPLSTLAGTLGIRRDTLRNHLQASGISRRFSDIMGAELGELVRHYKQGRPSAGLCFIVAYLNTRGLHVQRERVRPSMQRVDPLGRVLRHRTAVKRRTYGASRYNYVRHVDGHRKWIRWGIAIHGMVGGYCRTVGISYGPRHLLTKR